MQHWLHGILVSSSLRCGSGMGRNMLPIATLHKAFLVHFQQLISLSIHLGPVLLKALIVLLGGACDKCLFRKYFTTEAFVFFTENLYVLIIKALQGRTHFTYRSTFLKGFNITLHTRPCYLTHLCFYILKGFWGYWSIAFFQQVASLGNNIAIQIAAGSSLKVS